MAAAPKWDKDSLISLRIYVGEFHNKAVVRDLPGMEIALEKIQELINRREPENWETFKRNEALEIKLLYVRRLLVERG